MKVEAFLVEKFEAKNGKSISKIFNLTIRKSALILKQKNIA